MKSRRKLSAAGLVIGFLLMLAPVVGVIGTVMGMRSAFETLGSSGPAQPEALSESIGTVLESTAMGFILFPVGVVLFTVSLVCFLLARPSSTPQQPVVGTNQ